MSIAAADVISTSIVFDRPAAFPILRRPRASEVDLGRGHGELTIFHAVDKSDRYLGNVGQQLCLRETYYRVDASFRVRGVARVHRHVGAARLAGIVGPTAFSSPGSVAAF
jgi:hypothetical protein